MKKISSTNTKKNTAPDHASVEAAERLEHLIPPRDNTSSFTIVCRRSDYSAGRIAHAIEDCNANVLNLNVTSRAMEGDFIAVEVRVDRNDITSIVRSLDRYNFTVEVDGIDNDTITDSDRLRVAELLRYIDM